MSHYSTKKPFRNTRFGKILPYVGFIFFFPLLISLGFWQLNRAEFKQNLQNQFDKNKQAQLITYSQLAKQPTEYQYRKISLTGHFDNQHQFLLDNQIHKGQPGYFVLTPFFPINKKDDKKNNNKNKTAILINRGWIPLGQSRQVLPRLKPISGQITLNGQIKNPSHKSYKLNNKSRQIGQWPFRVQIINIKQLQKKLPYPILPTLILLNPDSPHGFLREWRAVNPQSTADKHYGYAFQWFGLALTLLIILILMEKKKRSRND